MKMYFYRGNQMNFGDELNLWLMPKIFPDFFDEASDPLFLGIGSILFDSHPAQSRKIVFGSGYGGYTKVPVIDDRWKIYCVRGPYTAAALNLDAAKVAGDSAILIARHFKRGAGRPAGTAFMPHFQSVERGNWQMACDQAGIRFIDPTLPVDHVLAALGQSEVLITEAMHGAIVADAIRLPWIPVLPLHHSHRMKWLDWAAPLGLTLEPRRLFPSSGREAANTVISAPLNRLRPLLRPFKPLLNQLDVPPVRPARQPFRRAANYLGFIDRSFVRLAAASLARAAKQPPMLSRDAALDRVVDQLQTHAGQILLDFPA